MSEAIIGVIAGGIIGVSGTIVTLYFSWRKFKTELLLKHLYSKRDRLETSFREAYEGVVNSLIKHRWPQTLIADFEQIFPDNVKDAFQKFKGKTKAKKSEKRLLLLKLNREMKKALVEIDDEIEKLLN